MKLFKIILFISFLLVPSMAFAWGPLTHLYLGNEILSFEALIPAGIYAMIKRYKSDFLYGNIIADIIFGKKLLTHDRNSHNWQVGLGLLDAAKSRQQKAFAYGYLSHLAADTVAHSQLIPDLKVGIKNIGHTILEFKADSYIDRKYWMLAVRFDRMVQRRNDPLLENNLNRALFSFKTNKRIFKGIVILSGLKQQRMLELIDRRFPAMFTQKRIERLHDESIERMIEVLSHGQRAKVMKNDPTGPIR